MITGSNFLIILKPVFPAAEIITVFICAKKKPVLGGKWSFKLQDKLGLLPPESRVLSVRWLCLVIPLMEQPNGEI